MSLADIPRYVVRDSVAIGSKAYQCVVSGVEGGFESVAALLDQKLEQTALLASARCLAEEVGYFVSV